MEGLRLKIEDFEQFRLTKEENIEIYEQEMKAVWQIYELTDNILKQYYAETGIVEETNKLEYPNGCYIARNYDLVENIAEHLGFTLTPFNMRSSNGDIYLAMSNGNGEILYRDITSNEQLVNWSIARMLGYYALGYKSAYCVMDFAFANFYVDKYTEIFAFFLMAPPKMVINAVFKYMSQIGYGKMNRDPMLVDLAKQFRIPIYFMFKNFYLIEFLLYDSRLDDQRLDSELIRELKKLRYNNKLYHSFFLSEHRILY